jgi:hypothetical protein
MQRTEEVTELNISLFTKELLLKQVMGPVLDLARVSNMGDRQFNQYSRSIKDLMYDVLRHGNDILQTAQNFKTSQTDDILPRVDSKNDTK